jgi:acetyltransferase-like isoleucine patch superfamily enzyme
MSNYFVHERAICETKDVGDATRIWAFVHILPGAKIGRDCNICDGVFIENNVTVGDRVTVKSGVQLWDGVQIEDEVFIGPNATFTNDRLPRSKHYPDTYLRTVVRRGASIGANATILPGVEIGTAAVIGAGAVVTASVPPYAKAAGNPARIIGYVTASEEGGPPGQDQENRGRATKEIYDLGVGDAKAIEFPWIKDMRGDLTVGEIERDLPFLPKRFFMVFDVPSRNVRGEHAHKICHQFLICAHGSCNVVIDDCVSRREIVLDHPTMGVHIPPMIWATQYKHSPGAVLFVFASELYDPDDYIRDYSEFRELKSNTRG